MRFQAESFHINVGAGDGETHLLTVDDPQGSNRRVIVQAFLIDGGRTTAVDKIDLLIAQMERDYSMPGNSHSNYLKFDGFITHWDGDHYGGLEQWLLNGIKEDTKRLIDYTLYQPRAHYDNYGPKIITYSTCAWPLKSKFHLNSAGNLCVGPKVSITRVRTGWESMIGMNLFRQYTELPLTDERFIVDADHLEIYILDALLGNVANINAPISKLRDEAGDSSPVERMQKLMSGSWFRPAEGLYWAAAGAHFTAFQTLAANIVLVLQFGNGNLLFGVFGEATCDVPALEAPLKFARVELGIVCTFDVNSGVSKFEAQSSPRSFFLAPQCHLTAWSKGEYSEANNLVSAGDWVLTSGRYYRAFRPPKQYPKPPRLGISWSLIACLSVKGEAYFAITTPVCMGGCKIRAALSLGTLYAWFDAFMDFLMSFEPFFFQMTARLSVGVWYTLDLCTEDHRASDDAWSPKERGNSWEGFANQWASIGDAKTSKAVDIWANRMRYDAESVEGNQKDEKLKGEFKPSRGVAPKTLLRKFEHLVPALQLVAAGFPPV